MRYFILPHNITLYNTLRKKNFVKYIPLIANWRGFSKTDRRVNLRNSAIT